MGPCLDLKPVVGRQRWRLGSQRPPDNSELAGSSTLADPRKTNLKLQWNILSLAKLETFRFSTFLKISEIINNLALNSIISCQNKVSGINYPIGSSKLGHSFSDLVQTRKCPLLATRFPGQGLLSPLRHKQTRYIIQHQKANDKSSQNENTISIDILCDSWKQNWNAVQP